MEGGLQTSPQLGYSIDNDDAECFSKYSTILVATIEEMKDRISQIEYIFCSQLFPNFKSSSKSLKKKFAEAMKAAEDSWKKKETALLLQVEEHKLGKKQALEEMRHLVASREKEKFAYEERRKAAEDDWRRKENDLRIQMERLQFENQKAVVENRSLVASLEQEKAKLMNYDQLLDQCDKEKKQLLTKLESLEKNGEVSELQDELTQKAEEVAEGKRLQEKLLRLIELKDSEVIIEKKKRKDVVQSYKKIKSQNNFLLNKIGVKVDGNKMEEERTLLSPQQNSKISNGTKSEDQQASGFVSKMKEQKDEICLREKLGDAEVSRINQNSSSHLNVKSPSTSSPLRPKKLPVSVKSEPVVGVKRPASHWRDTRSRQEPGCADPHDDFLNTPMENIKGNLSKALEEVKDVAVPAPKDMDFNSSDDETQDLNQEPVAQKQPISISIPGDKGFKYVEPVRKKADRENLKGFECKQCKKFYDAVLPDGGKNVENSKNSNFRCEHHDGVSRHRYRYLPPMTPEGFWNIGFDSEM